MKNHIKQYLHFKDKYPEAVVLYSLPETNQVITFYEDALTLQKELGFESGLVEDNVLFVTFEAVRRDAVTRKLVDRGYKTVWLAEVQRPASKVIKRDIVKIIG